MTTVRPRQTDIRLIAADLPNPELRELIADTSLDDWPDYAPTQIAPGLFQGGTEDHDVLSLPGDDFATRGNYPFDTVVTLYASAQPVPWGVEELRFGFLDAALGGDDIDTVVRAARFAYHRWQDGAQVMIRCQAGMNRSGLVTALVLIQAGLTPAQAISLIRLQRGSACLFNTHFVAWLVEHAEDTLNLSSPSAA